MSSRFIPVTDEQIFLLNGNYCGSAKQKEGDKVLFKTISNE
jgi:hypothetical protein